MVFSHKTTNGAKNGAFSQNVGMFSNILLQLFQLDARTLNRQAILKVRFSSKI